MILEWSLSNFKSVRQTPKLKFAPLTIFCGANSSGKSTLIQSILMISQTLGSPNVTRPLVLNGELIRLGYLNDVIHHGMDAKPIFIDCKMQWRATVRNHSTIPLQEVDFSLVFEKPENFDTQTSKVNLTHSILRFGEQQINVQVAQNEELLTRINMDSYDVIPELHEDIRVGKYNYQYEIRPYDEQHISLDKDANLFNSRCSLRHFLPYYSLEMYDAEAERIKGFLEEIGYVIQSLNAIPSDQLASIEIKSSTGQVLRDILGRCIKAIIDPKSFDATRSKQDLNKTLNELEYKKTIGDWLTSAQRIMRLNTFAKNRLRKEISWFTLGRYEIKSRNKRIGLRVGQLNPEVTRTSDRIVDFFTNGVKYLGPLRDDPKMIFSLPPIPDMRDVGMKGEFTAAVLERFGKDIKVDCPIPPEKDGYVFKTEKIFLIDAVTLWLNHMGLVKKVVTADFAKMGVGLTVESGDNGKQLDLTNVGVGVSQVLPLLTVCLLTPVDGTVMIEQPELHLHPKVQSMLGDFFIGIAARGTQCVLETHSDRLINRIRRRIAEDMEDKVYGLSRIYMIEKENSETEIVAVEPNEYGALPRWPKGFFDEGPDESTKIVEAASKKREARLKR
ncbi:MAG: AAA family ATPase [Chloroflexi bacterium]|nr:AAA family ATPase [Chloroflexota bacterium]